MALHASGTLLRCAWAGSDPLMQAYHDNEWGVPCYDDTALFERLVLESFQSGLSWALILRKRAAFTRAFDQWDAEKIAAYGADETARLLADASIVRNRAKIAATITNARAFLAVQQSAGSFASLLWSFVGGAPRVTPAPRSPSELPASTAESSAMARELRARGFRFVGPTVCYALMQSTGMVNDHLADCFTRQAQPG